MYVQFIISMYFDRLYWLDRKILKSSTTTGSDIKTHVITNGATKIVVYKVIFITFFSFKLTLTETYGELF